MPDRQQSIGSSIRLDLPGGLRMYGWGARATRRTAGQAETGPRSVLLLHGLGDDHTAFPPTVIEGLSAHLDVLAPDLVGFGRTTAPPGFDYSIDAHAAALESVLATLPAPAVLIGHSLGGAIASRIAARATGRSAATGRVAGLVSVEGNLTVADCFLSRRAIVAADRGKFERWWSLLPGVLEARETAPRYRAVFRRANGDAYLRTARSLYGETEAGTLARAFFTAGVPRLFLHGGTVAVETLATLREQDVETVAFPDAPHWLIEHDPLRFLDRVTTWIERLADREA